MAAIAAVLAVLGPLVVIVGRWVVRRINRHFTQQFDPLKHENEQLRREIETRLHLPTFSLSAVQLTEIAAERKVEELEASHRKAIEQKDEELAARVSEELRELTALRADLDVATARSEQLQEALDSVVMHRVTTPYSKLSHAELQQDALRLAEGLRQWSTRMNVEDFRRGPPWKTIVGWEEMSESAKAQAMSRDTDNSIERLLRRSAEYAARFKADALNLRAEIISRLPDDADTGGEWIQGTYEQPGANSYCFEEISTNLERLAKSLTDGGRLRKNE